MNEEDLITAIDDWFNGCEPNCYSRDKSTDENITNCKAFMKKRFLETKKIKEWKHSISAKWERARQEYDKVSSDLNKETANMQSQCPHRRKTYHSDPSGGRDSYYECNHCGKYL